MSVSLKPLNEQVIVITGASSGIGLATARMAAKAGAKLVLVSRNEDALRQLEQEIRSAGGQAVVVAADVGNEADVQCVSETAIAKLGGFDTWVNNAGVSIYGRIDEISTDDHRRLFETNFWGVVYGSRVAAAHLRGRTGGALINVGSTVSDRAVPLQGMYSASKHAVKGFTDALRMELEETGAPVSVTLIKPAAIDTPYVRHAKNYMDEEPDFPPPVYAPEVVASAILHAATHPVRDVHVGGASKMFQVMDKYMPRMTDKYMERALFRQQKGGPPRRDRAGALHSAAGPALQERGGYQGHVMKSSLYTQATTHPLLTTAILGAAGVAVAALVGATTTHREPPPGWRGVPERTRNAARRTTERVRDWWS